MAHFSPTLHRKAVDRQRYPGRMARSRGHQRGEHLVTFDADFKKLLKRTQLTVLSPE